ncbi:hypothetical protein, partial [Sphingobium yanoikuyae]|jgi:hypothetical protein|uniref:hypothetical protein n=1 Tax=Sphingobium yanoikuyae TaxID=13690 RepID=UPI001BE4DE94
MAGPHLTPAIPEALMIVPGMRGTGREETGRFVAGSPRWLPSDAAAGNHLSLSAICIAATVIFWINQ